MKVLQVIDSDGLYGAERVVLALMDKLVEMDVGLALASIAEPGQPPKALEIEARQRGFRVERITMNSGPDRKGAMALAGWACAEGFDVLHTHGYKANALISGMRRSRRSLPAVATLHGWTSAHPFSRMRAYEMVERIMLRRADRVVAVSSAMVERWRLARRYGRRLEVVANGIEPPSAMGARRVNGPELSADLAEFIDRRTAIFAAGRLSREKGFDVLLDALAILRRQGLDACLVLVGEGDQRSTLEAQADRLGIAEAVRMPGYLACAARMMQSFSMLSIPSRTEGLPVVLLEALLAGIPVAATAVGDIPAVMASCGAGSCVAPEDPQGLAQRIREFAAADNESYSRVAVAEAAARRYSARSMSEAYHAIYTQMQAEL